MNVEAKVFGFEQFGDIDVLKEKDTIVQLSPKKDVLVRVERVGINPVDTVIRSGGMSDQASPDKFTVLGSELQGEIIDLYQPIDGLNIGDKVIVKSRSGAYAEAVSANHSNVYKIPENMPLDFAAGFSMTATTAYWALHGNFFTIKPKDTVAVVGASGAVGSFIVQLLKEFDVRILAIASEKNRDYLIDLGATSFIDYHDKTSVDEHSNEADIVIDASLFNSGQQVAMKVVKPHGTYLGLNSLPTLDESKPVTSKLLTRSKSMTTDIAMNALLHFYETFGLSLTIAYHLPLTLEGVKEAHELIASSRKSGKILLSRDDSE